MLGCLAELEQFDGLVNKRVTWFWPDASECNCMGPEDDVFFVPVLWTEVKSGFLVDMGGIKGLLLVRHGEDTYRKVGLFQFGKRIAEDESVYNECKQWQREFMQAPEVDFILI